MQDFLEHIDLQSEKIGPRLKEIRNTLGMTVEEFYKPLMKSFNNGSSIENNKRKLGKRLAKDIINHHQINPVYLATGNGKKLLGPSGDNILAKSGTNQHGLEESVPYYDVNLADLQWKSPDLFGEHAAEYYVNYRPFNDCTAYLPVFGDSMYPRFSNGEIIAVKEVTNHGIILWGEAYLVVTDERANSMVTVKLLYEHDDATKIVLRSCNPAYKGDTVIDKKSIAKLFIIKGKITRNQL